MKLSQIHLTTLRESPKDELSVGASLLIRAGFIEKLGAGIYNYLPFGLRVLNKISAIIRFEMEKIGGQEILMAALHPDKNWKITGRWQTFDALLKTKSRFGQEYGLGPTHEEIVTPLAGRYISSYRDLPLYLFQIQTKFRDEPRAKSGLMRGKEFLMKDLYSFHYDEKDLDRYYEIVKKSYLKIFKKCGLKVLVVESSGGTFSKFSDEFQVITPTGEDSVYHCSKCGFSRNKEIAAGLAKCPCCGAGLKIEKCSEVGNIFKLKDGFSNPFNLTFRDKNSREKIVFMGCYGIGISRLMGVVAEVCNDAKGLVWPENIAPYKFNLLPLFSGNRAEDKQIQKQANQLYQKIMKLNLETLYDDREGLSAGEKLMDADLFGIPHRIVVSSRSLKQKSIEFKERKTNKIKLIKISHFDKLMKKFNI